MRLAMLTVSPQMSKAYLRLPTMPATTGPLWTPTRRRHLNDELAFLRSTKLNMRRPTRTQRCAWSAHGLGKPAAAM